MKKNKILLIENQEYQFDQISENLQVFEVMPIKKEYFDFIECIKIFINEFYEPTYIEEAKSKLLVDKYFKDIDLIVMDYRLGANKECKTGLDLALFIWENYPKVPILFFTSSYLDSKKWTEEYEKFKSDSVKFTFAKHDRLSKGYIGEPDFDSNYMKTTVVNKINELIKKGTNNVDYLTFIGNLEKLNPGTESKKNTNNLLNILKGDKEKFNKLDSSIIDELNNLAIEINGSHAINPILLKKIIDFNNSFSQTSFI